MAKEEAVKKKNEKYAMIIELANTLSVEVTPDIVSLMGKDSSTSVLSDILIDRAIEGGKSPIQV